MSAPTSPVRSFLRDDDLSPAEQAHVLGLAATLKAAPYDHRPLAGPRTVATIYDKPTLRTQSSFSAGIAELGGHPMLVDGGLAGIGVRESVADVARVLGRQASVIVWRTFAQAKLEEMAAYAAVPVVNALTDEFHPCQLLADLLTIREHKGTLAGLTVVFLGDAACNMGNSWALAGVTAGMHVRFGAPEGYTPDAEVLATAATIGAQTGGSVELHADPARAVAEADVLVTDTWVSMGKEDEAAQRVAVFSAYALTADLVAQAKDDAIVMHCLPAYRGKEIDAEVIDGPQSVVWDEAENRRHAQKAILTFLAEESGLSAQRVEAPGSSR
ncbi:ornithine carbamoyltransferase [Nocardioides sp. BP30]|uniref:ornithine carbamoyltransferase n=1 Tax=Nocardioides sp. BP30 TaxID=3036374 RepID=UPI00246854CA|nr:ornithine carbamoyltransferase [Nocardioides sp. BP30]WGL50508.1 ornithine carbamoyltransferase [Nocardioides sp. BP30]